MRLTNEETKIKLSDTKRYDLQDHKMFTKLSQYEDIEEELGIDFITLIKALKNGVYLYTTHCDYTEEQIDFFKYKAEVGGTLDLEEKYFIIFECCAQGEYSNHKLYFKDYGKTWALTKEELE